MTPLFLEGSKGSMGRRGKKRSLLLSIILFEKEKRGKKRRRRRRRRRRGKNKAMHSGKLIFFMARYGRMGLRDMLTGAKPENHKILISTVHHIVTWKRRGGVRIKRCTVGN